MGFVIGLIIGFVIGFAVVAYYEARFLTDEEYEDEIREDYYDRSDYWYDTPEDR